MWEKGGKEGPNIWQDHPINAPFDQRFYLILNVAVHGNFFPNNKCGKTPVGNQQAFMA